MVKPEEYSYSCSKDGHGLAYPGFSVVFIQTFSLDPNLKFILPEQAVLPKDEYLAKIAERDEKASQTMCYDAMADLCGLPIVLMERNIEKQIFFIGEGSNLASNLSNGHYEVDSKSVYRLSLKGFDFRMPVVPGEEEDFEEVELSGHVYVEMSLFFGNTVSLTYRFCFNGHAAKVSKVATTDHIIALLSAFLGAEYWSDSKVSVDGKNAPQADRLAAQSNINLDTELYVDNLWIGDEGEVLAQPRCGVDLSGNGRMFDRICLMYKNFLVGNYTSFSDALTWREKLTFQAQRKNQREEVLTDSHYAMVDVWENVRHPVPGQPDADLFAKGPDGLTEAQIISHIRDFHKPELIGLMTLYPCEWPYRDEQAYGQVCGENIAIDTDDLVLAGSNVSVVIGTYGRRGVEVIKGESVSSSEVSKQGVDWARHLKERAKYHVSWPEYLLILQMVLAKKHIIGIAKDELIDVTMAAVGDSSKELIGQNAKLGIRMSRLVLQLDLVKYSKFASHKVMFDRTTDRLELDKDMEQLRDIVDMVDSSLHNLADYSAMKSDSTLNVILLIISCASTFELFFQNSEMPFLTYFHIGSSGLSAWLVTLVATITIFGLLLVLKNIIISVFMRIKLINFRKQYEAFRDTLRLLRR